jgi:UrcA family protein
MNIQLASTRFTIKATLSAAALAAVCAFAPAAVVAEQTGTSSGSKSAKVSLADLNLSTPEGMAIARDRLHQTARVVCDRVADSLDLSRQPNFVKCVDETVANALRQIQGSALAAGHDNTAEPATAAAVKRTQAKQTGDAPVTRSAKVSLDGLDLSTPEGARAAHERLHEAARLACSRVVDSLDLSRQSNFVACVDETMAATLRAARGPSVASDAQSNKATQHTTP